MGWQPDLLDPRDYTLTSPTVKPILECLGFGRGKKTKFPNRVDLRDENLLLPPQDQGPLGSSCAFAVLDLVEYLERKYLGRSLEASNLLLHQLTVRLATSSPSPGATGSLRTTLRTTFKALTRFGAPPARFWPYDRDHFDREPTHPLLFSFTREYASLQYFRLDTSTTPSGPVRASPQNTLRNVKRLLALGIPCLCGIAVPCSLTFRSLTATTNSSAAKPSSSSATKTPCREPPAPRPDRTTRPPTRSTNANQPADPSSFAPPGERHGETKATPGSGRRMSAAASLASSAPRLADSRLVECIAGLP